MSRVTVTIPELWTPAQAMAVIELLDDLREHIWALYDLRLLDAYRQERQPTPTAPSSGDPPF